jgi:prevent-host-death family protein
MTTYDIHEAKTHFSELIERVVNGEEVVIAKAGKPVARILPIAAKNTSPRKPGNDKGKITIMPDFDDPLPEFDM